MEFKIFNIWTWNINSIRSKINLVNKLLIQKNIDLLLITETKIKPIHESTLEFNEDYNYIWNSNKTGSIFHGICIIYKKYIKDVDIISSILPASIKISNFKILNEKNYEVITNVTDKKIEEDIGKAHNNEGRILTVKFTVKDTTLIVVGTYVPNSGVNKNDPLKRLAYRVKHWDQDLYNHLLNLEKTYKNIIWLGDLNVARLDKDIFNPKINIAGTTREERNNFNNFITTNNWIDTWDYINPNIKTINQRLTYGNNIFCKLRLDYVICSNSLKNNILSSTIDQNFNGSDHVPIGTTFKF